MIRVCGPKDKAPDSDNIIVVNTTSRSTSWSRGLSPFFLGPVDLYDGRTAKNVENGWQYAKVYREHLSANGDPTPEYFAWAETGWAKQQADRYPMGKGKAPEFSFWAGKKLGYIDARKQIYIPLYATAVQKSEAFKKLKQLKEENSGELWLWDFDGYDHVKHGIPLDEVVNVPSRKMGHAFVLAMLLSGML